MSIVSNEETTDYNTLDDALNWDQSIDKCLGVAGRVLDETSRGKSPLSPEDAIGVVGSCIELAKAWRKRQFSAFVIDRHIRYIDDEDVVDDAEEDE